MWSNAAEKEKRPFLERAKKVNEENMKEFRAKALSL